MAPPPGPDPVDVNLVFKVIGIVLGPASLAGGFAGLATLRLAAVELLVRIAGSGNERGLAATALEHFGVFHDPEPPDPSSNTAGKKRRKARKSTKKTEELRGKQVV